MFSHKICSARDLSIICIIFKKNRKGRGRRKEIKHSPGRSLTAGGNLLNHSIKLELGLRGRIVRHFCRTRDVTEVYGCFLEKCTLTSVYMWLLIRLVDWWTGGMVDPDICARDRATTCSPP